MDFLCPHCQKMLQVPDQYAGTLMKCPLCANTFQAPALPAKQPPPPPGGFPPPPPPPGRPSDAFAAPAPPPVPGAAPPPPPPTPSPGQYTGKVSVPLEPKVLQWVPPAALLLVFVLILTTPWVGMYPGGYPAYTQGAGGAAFGWYNVAPNPLWEKMRPQKEDVPDVNKNVPAVTLPGAKKEDKVEGLAWSVPLMVYLFPLMPLALVLAVVAAVLPLVKVPLPPIVDQLKPWRWAAAAGVTLLALLALLVPLVFGFSLENKVKADVEGMVKAQKDKATSEEDKQLVEMARGSLQGAQGVKRTLWLQLVFWLQVLAVVTAGVMFWLDWRGQRPAPRLDLRW